MRTDSEVQGTGGSLSPRADGYAREARVAWVDMARLIAIFTVCQAHSPMAFRGDLIISHGALVLFFFLAGYFNRSGCLGSVAVRCGKLLLCYVLWCVISCSLSSRGVEVSWQRCVDTVVYGTPVLWFIRYLVPMLLLGWAVQKLRPAWQAVVLAVWCAVAAGVHVCHGICPGVLPGCVAENMGFFQFFAAFLLGSLWSAVPVVRLGESLFPGFLRRSRWVFLAVAWLPLGWLAWLVWNGGTVPCWLLTAFCVAWLLAAAGYALAQVAPRAVAVVAQGGPAVILVYLCNATVIRMFTSGYIKVFGGYQPHWVTFLLIGGIMAGCSLLFRLVHGRCRWADLLLFAR